MNTKEKVLSVIPILIIFAVFLLFFNAELTGFSPLITGHVSVTNVSLDIFVISNKEIDLVKGWNFVSFYTNFSNNSIGKVMESVEPDYEYLLEWDSIAQDFKIWSRSSGTKEFSEFNKNKSYFIFMNQNRTLNFSEGEIGNYSIDLIPGWESPNYVLNFESSITNNTFYNATFDYMLKWDNVNQEFLIRSSQSQNPQFSSISRTQGYFVKTDGGRVVYIDI